MDFESYILERKITFRNGLPSTCLMLGAKELASFAAELIMNHSADMSGISVNVKSIATLYDMQWRLGGA